MNDYGNKAKLFPEAVINQSADYLFFSYNKRSQLLYLIIIIVVLLTFISLFIIKIDIGVGVNGMIKHKGEKTIISSPNSGILSFVNMEENKKVNKGDTLFVVIADNITSQQKALLSRKKELSIMLDDLFVLLSNENEIENIKSDFYRKSYVYFISQLTELQLKKDAVEKNYNRDKILAESDILSKYEFEKIKAEYNSAKTAIEILKSRQIAQWQDEKNNYELEQREVKTKLLQIDITNRDLVICSPISGVIQSVMNVNNGSYVHEGQQIVEISPEGNLLLECYVQPKDIGLLKTGQKCRIQIDAFNYNDWGIITGNLSEIYNDIFASNDKSSYFYKVYCSLDTYELQLKNGYKGYIKKGMTAKTRFIVTKRSCAQLLYDKIDDWLNPMLRTNDE